MWRVLFVTRQLAANCPMPEITPLATAGVAGFFHVSTLDETMSDRISMPHLIFENFLTRFC